MTNDSVGTTQSDAELTGPVRPGPEPKSVPSADAEPEEISPDGVVRRRLARRSAKLLIYTPPLVQLFLPRKAMAGTYSS